MPPLPWFLNVGKEVSKIQDSFSSFHKRQVLTHCTSTELEVYRCCPYPTPFSLHIYPAPILCPALFYALRIRTVLNKTDPQSLLLLFTEAVFHCYILPGIFSNSTSEIPHLFLNLTKNSNTI